MVALLLSLPLSMFAGGFAEFGYNDATSANVKAIRGLIANSRRDIESLQQNVKSLKYALVGAAVIAGGCCLYKYWSKKGQRLKKNTRRKSND